MILSLCLYNFCDKKKDIMSSVVVEEDKDNNKPFRIE